MDVPQTVIDKILKKAAEKTNYEQCEGGWGYSPGANGNYDDAHSDGYDDGEIYFARTIRRELGLEPK